MLEKDGEDHLVDRVRGEVLQRVKKERNIIKNKEKEG